jgi:outer membrane protein OmpA-like peptidoglycan-associated protein
MRALLPALLLTGCLPVAGIQADHDALTRELTDARTHMRCKPVDLALAESNLAFAEVELDEGDLRRAQEHLTEGRAHVAIANACPVDTERRAVTVPRPEDTLPESQMASRPEPEPEPKPEPKPAPPPPPPTPTDKDGDGILDADDVCVNDPEDLDGFKDADGCPDLDNDNDGVNDSLDRCGTQPEDRDGFEDTDGCPDADNDRDGLPDAQDRCPNEAGAAADGGCPSQDHDRDGVPDNADQCPAAAETPNGYMDTDGCPDEKPSRVEVTGSAIVIHQKINFATGKDVILPDSFPVLDDVAQAMKDYPKIKVEIGGHTDNVGDDAKNQKLSKERADAVFEYLLAKGIAAPRMITIGYGETRPIDTNRTEEGRANNRRVEFLIVEGGPAAPAPASAPAPMPW